MRKLLSLILAFTLLTSNVLGASLEMDYMEYSSDANAQAAWVSNGLADNELSNPSFETWSSGDSNPPDSWTLQNGATAAKESTIKKVGSFSLKLTSNNNVDESDAVQDVYASVGGATARGKLFTLGAWVWASVADKVHLRFYDGSSSELYVDSAFHPGDSAWHWLTVKKTLGVDATSCRLQCRMAQAPTYSAYFDGVILIEGNGDGIDGDLNYLQSYSESTIKTQGSYSLKGIAAITDSLNKTLTRTVSPTIDLTGINQVRLRIRSSRTGSNIKIGLHDSGGTTTEITPNILSADTWQEVKINLQNVSNANKDVIDSIIITIVNADAENTFYIDELISYTLPNIVTS